MAMDDYIPVDEYIRRELGWRDLVVEDADEEDEFVRYLNPVNEYCDGPYARLQSGCCRRLPCAGSDEAE